MTEPVTRPLPGPATPRWLRPALVRLIIMMVVFLGADALIGLVSTAVIGSWVASIVLGLAFAVLALLLYRLAIRVIERRRATEIGLGGAAAQLGRGTLLGLVLFAALVGLIAAFGGYRITGVGGVGGVGGAVAVLGMMCAISVIEELVFRGVLFRLVEELAGTWVALGVAAVVFGGLHLINPHATIAGAIGIALEAGGMIGAAYVLTRRLWLPIGLHLGWNFAESGIFSTTVSGTANEPVGLLRSVIAGPDLITGGQFGPEASVLAIAICLIPTIYFLRTAQRRGLIFGRARSHSAAAGRSPVTAQK